MQRFLSSFFAVALLAAFFTAGAGEANAAIHWHCGRGSHWIPAHRDREGRLVKGHCG